MRITATIFCLSLLFLCSNEGFAQSAVIASGQMHVDQFGYRPESDKVAVLSNPTLGFDSAVEYIPGSTLEVKRWSNSATVFSGPAVAWGGGDVHSQSGNQVWWFDFSTLTSPGVYFIYDPSNDLRSHPFEIREDVYTDVLNAAVKMFYFNRCNTEKLATHATAAWADGTSFLGSMQDSEAWLVGSQDASTSRDLSGGWFDAGDYNKYINFADGPVHQLLDAYTANPEIWLDNLNIPESGNGVPDLLDELKWELDWFLKMQEADGSVLHKVSNLTFNAASPPSSDTEERRYAPATYSAAASATGVFAHAALVYEAQSNSSMSAFGTILRNAALLSWTWLQNNPTYSAYDNAGFLNATAEDSEYLQMANTAISAIHLFALTGDASYRDFVDAAWPDIHLNQWGYAYVFESEVQDAFLYYSTLPGATAAVASDIRSDYEGSINGTAENFPSYGNDTDAYRASMLDNNHSWGNNRDKSLKGDMYLNMLRFGIASFADSDYKKAAEEYVHYIHGVNPLNMVYLTNMGSLGAENSASTMYHSWFSDGSPLWDQVGVSTYGPAPGYVTGGVNPNYAPDDGSILDPPQNQPILKSYLDFNDGWPEASWEISEPSITYQAAYVKLLSEFVSSEASLSISSIELTAQSREDAIEFSWAISGDPTGDSFQLEYQSSLGSGFRELLSVDLETRSASISKSLLVGRDHNFRIRHLELDGSVMFSNLYSIETETATEAFVTDLFPNPSQRSSTIQVQTNRPGNVDAQLFDSNGRQVSKLFDVYLREGETHSFDINSSNLSPGVYFITLESHSGSKRLKFVVLD